MTTSPMIVTNLPIPGSANLQAVYLKLPRQKRQPAIPANVKARIEEYQTLYRKKYGVGAEVTWDKPWIRIGSSNGVSLQRFRQLIQQLKY